MLLAITDGHRLEPAIKHQNLARQYDFMQTAFLLWVDQSRPQISHVFLKDLNFYAAHNLSNSPGQYRDLLEEDVTVGNHIPPKWSEVSGHMDSFIKFLENNFYVLEPLRLSAFALWRLNWIHPFCQGNGRTARAVSYFIICQKLDKWFPGKVILPELIRQNRDEYCKLLMDADNNMDSSGNTNLDPLILFINRLLKHQLSEPH